MNKFESGVLYVIYIMADKLRRKIGRRFSTHNHPYMNCNCAKKIVSHCWWCGKVESNPLHDRGREQVT